MNGRSGYKVRTTRGGGRPFAMRLCRLTKGRPPPRAVLTLLLDRHAVDAPVVDDHDALAQREEACELRLTLDEREVLVAAELDRRLGQLRFGLELGVRPHVVAQVEGLVADLAHGRGGCALLLAQRVLLRAVALALADGHLAARRLRGLLRRR